MSQKLFAGTSANWTAGALDANFTECYGFAKNFIADGTGNQYIGQLNADPAFNRVNCTKFYADGAFTFRAPRACDIGISTTSGAHFYFYTDNGSARVTAGSITSSGSTSSFNTTSDRRLKTSITPAGDAGATLDAIDIVAHAWTVEGSTPVRWGAIAQDLALVVPEAVTPGDDGATVVRAWGVDWSKLVPLLVLEVQSLRRRVAALEAA